MRNRIRHTKLHVGFSLENKLTCYGNGIVTHSSHLVRYLCNYVFVHQAAMET